MNMSPTKDLNSAFVNIFKPYFDTIFFISVIPTSSSEIWNITEEQQNTSIWTPESMHCWRALRSLKEQHFFTQ